jgi:NADH dehydrogenase
MRMGNVTGADPDANELRYTSIDGRMETVRYDQLIVALGSVSRTLPIPGLAEHGVGFKTLAEGIALRNQAVMNLEIAESIEDAEERRAYLTFVFVGAGYAGLEGIAELQDYIGFLIHRYPRCRIDGTRWILVEALERVMPEISPALAAFAERELRGRGIEIYTGTRLESMDERTATLSTGEVVPTRLVCWTAGVKPPAVVGELGLPLTEAGRIETDATMRVKGRDNVWAIGDSAAVPDPAKKRRQPTPPTAQHALRQGKVVAGNVVKVLKGGEPRNFRYRTLGVFVDMGRNRAVAEMLGVIKLSGFPAWFAARTYHMVMMPGVGRRVRLIVDWTVALFFGRAAAELGQLGHPPPLTEEHPRPADQ